MSIPLTGLEVLEQRCDRLGKSQETVRLQGQKKTRLRFVKSKYPYPNLLLCISTTLEITRVSFSLVRLL